MNILIICLTISLFLRLIFLIAVAIDEVETTKKDFLKLFFIPFYWIVFLFKKALSNLE